MGLGYFGWGMLNFSKNLKLQKIRDFQITPLNMAMRANGYLNNLAFNSRLTLDELGNIHENV